MHLNRSEQAFQEARTLIPGGVNSPARAFGAVGGCPVFMERGEGAYLYDIDDNRYLDYVCSWGPMILGHCHPRVSTALHSAVSRGTSFGTPTVAESRLARLVIDAFPSVELVRFVNSGTEATMSAIRLARGYTGREKIIKFSGNYHGHADSLLIAAGSAGATLGVPDSPGVTRGAAQDTLILPYNDINALRDVFNQKGEEIACVIVEAVSGNMGVVPSSAEFRRVLRELCTESGAVLIYDEVMTGFRVSYGGAQERFGEMPDLTTFGKIIGGGLPVGAYGGKEEIMKHVIPSGKVFQAGTLSGNPLATSAGIATLETLRDTPPYPYLEHISEMLGMGIQAAAHSLGIPLSLNRVGSMLTFFFQEGPVTDWISASRSDTSMYAKFFWGMLRRGVYLPCSQYEAFFLSSAHTEEDIMFTVQTATAVLKECVC